LAATFFYDEEKMWSGIGVFIQEQRRDRELQSRNNLSQRMKSGRRLATNLGLIERVQWDFQPVLRHEQEI